MKEKNEFERKLKLCDSTSQDVPDMTRSIALKEAEIAIHEEEKDHDHNHGSPEAKPEDGALSAAQKGSAPEALAKQEKFQSAL